jgi:hypothetical protein
LLAKIGGKARGGGPIVDTDACFFKKDTKSATFVDRRRCQSGAGENVVTA